MADKQKNKQILEGSRAVALTIKNINPAVVSAYPITPQTHIVEDLAKFKADGKADYEYVRAESEFAAASIVEGASAAGARVYTATSSQGLLLMTEVLFNIAGMRLPVVLTCANRGVSAPITIWNDHQDAMTVRDSGWIIMFAENHQEAVLQHLLAYKIAEKNHLPVMINMDGFVLTHSYESVQIPDKTQIKKFLPDYNPGPEEFLNTKNPVTMGAFATPAHYMEIRKKLFDDLKASAQAIQKEYDKCSKIFSQTPDKTTKENNGLVEYFGPQKPKQVLVAMGSVVGTIKNALQKNKSLIKTTGVLKIKTYRPFPAAEIARLTQKAKFVGVLEKAISLGSYGPLFLDAAQALGAKPKAKNYIVGLGGKDITEKMIVDIAQNIAKDKDLNFITK